MSNTDDKRDWDLVIPLIEGGQAILRVPIPLTDEDFDMLKSVITSNLDALRRAIVRTQKDGSGMRLEHGWRG